MSPDAFGEGLHQNQGGGTREAGAPAPDGTGKSVSEFPGPEGLVRLVDAAPVPPENRGRRIGRPKQYDSELRVRMTDEQREKVEALRAADGCPAAEAVRRLIDGTQVPEPREVVAVDPDQYRALLDALAGIRTELNRGVGNVYRLVRDSYSDGVPDDSEIAALRADLESGLEDLAGLARVVQEVSPW